MCGQGIADLVCRTDTHDRRRVTCMVYEVATFQTLREQLRRKEIWVVGADRWRDPDEDPPADYESRRAEHYRAQWRLVVHRHGSAKLLMCESDCSDRSRSGTAMVSW